jgi:signal transduction histidine kinase
MKDVVNKVLKTEFGSNFLSSTVHIFKKDRKIQLEGILYVVRNLSDEILGINLLIHANHTDDYKVKAFQQRAHMRAVSQYVFGCAHNLTNSLMAIWNTTNLIKMDYNLNSNTTGLLKDIEVELDKAKTITNQLFEITQKKHVAEKYRDFEELLKNFITMNTYGTKINCIFNIDSDLKNVGIEKLQISNILGNIILNSIESMPNGGDILVEAHNVYVKEKEIAELPQGEYVKVAIKDSGIGIPEEDMGLLFEPNFTTKADRGAQGLGLKITKHLLKQNKGTIEIKSVQGEGTIVIMYFPVGVWKSEKALTTEK